MEESAMDHAALSSSSTANDDRFAAVVKGKRTKRQRAPASSSSTASSVEVSSTTTTTTATEEEEDMANCLILLAQGRSLDAAETAAPEKRTPAPSGKASAPAGEFVYQCKTCSRCFPSFQALGGHRTSHKKPKTAPPQPPPPPLLNGEKKTIGGDEDGAAANSSISKSASTTATSIKPRMHECSICGSEFSSGQALGGHMRRHRPIPAAEPPKEKNVFALDLNLPAPSDDDATSPPPAAAVFPFESQPPLVFSAAAWVDCHY